MPEYLAPGVYVEEVDTGSKPIEGVSTSTAGFIGMTKRGATTGLPQLVTSFADFQRKFGGYFDLGPIFTGLNVLPYAVEGFFTNGGKRVYIMRVIPTGATGASIATTTAQGGLVTRLREDTVPNPAAVRRKLKTTTLRGINVGTKMQLRMIKDGIAKDSPVLTVAQISRANGEITVDVDISSTIAFEARYTTVFTDAAGTDNKGVLTALPTPLDPRPNTIVINAHDEGSWGKDVVIQASHESAARAEMQVFVSGLADDDSKIRLKSTAGFYPNAWVEIDRGNSKRYRKIKSVNGNVLTLFGLAMVANDVASELAAPNNVTIFSTCEFRLLVSYGGVTELFASLTLENIPGRYYADQINNRSSLISVVGPAPAGTSPLAYPSGGDGLRMVLDQGGSDGANVPTDQDFIGVDNGPGKRGGLKALEDIDQVSILAAPGLTSQVVQNALIEQCERLKDRFAILDPQPRAGNTAPDMNDIQAQRSLYDSKYAAIYYPRILVSDPLTGNDIPLAPSGHIAGIYARTDIERGVHKAPANETIRSITGLESKLNKEEQDILNPYPVNINALRDFRSSERGYRVWGARVITSDPDWKYINVRRLFIYIEESIDEGTQWVVFEPNDEPLWARVRRTVSAFLTSVWRDGALQGATPEEAFFVKCDRTTMSQDDIDNGRLIILVGIAPVKPAEFVIFRIGQWAGGSSVVEG